MATKTVHVCDRCGSESESAHKSLVVTITGQGSQKSRDMCVDCLRQLDFFFAHPNELSIRTPIEPAAVIQIARRQASRQ